MITQSPTSLSTFLTCPRQYEAKYITKEVVFQDTPHTLFGSALHKAIEDRLMLGEPLPALLAPMEDLLARMSTLPNMWAEKRLAADKAGRPTTFFDRVAYLRCIVDVLIDAGETVVCVDWKTGKKRDHQTQHNIIRSCAAANFPDAKEVVTIFVYLFTGQSDRQVWKVGDTADPAMAKTKMDLFDLALAHETGKFPTRKSGLCSKWCDVLSCEFNGRRE